MYHLYLLINLNGALKVLNLSKIISKLSRKLLAKITKIQTRPKLFMGSKFKNVNKVFKWSDKIHLRLRR